jgi:hypothetical protein
MVALNPPSVGVVASIKCELPFRNMFETAVKSNSVSYTSTAYKDGLGYDQAALQSAVDYFTNTVPVGLL